MYVMYYVFTCKDMFSRYSLVLPKKTGRGFKYLSPDGHIPHSIKRKKVTRSVLNIAKILIVEDSPTVNHLMKRVLQKGGYQVTTASNGRDGWMKVLQERPHCIILDVVLPDINGFALCRQLRTIDPNHSLSIILVSTKNTPLDQKWGLRQGADFYLFKPFSDEMLVQAVESVLGKN
jgi:CheY-like chemotaxis protein